MTIIDQARRNVLKRDLDGIWYSIPENLSDTFIRMLEEIQNAEFMAPEWFQANDEFATTFCSYARVENAA